MLASPVKCMAVTPYTFGVGERKGENAYLTPDVAIKTVFDRVGAISGELAPDNFGKSAIVLLLIAAPEPGSLAQALSAFNAVYPIKELQRAERRAGALATLEIDKFVIPPGPAGPVWKNSAPLNNVKGQAMNAAAGAQLALAEGMQAAQKDALAVLSDFGTKVREKARATQDKLAELQASFSGNRPGQNYGQFGLYLDGPIVDLLRILSGFAPPLPEVYKCTSLIAWVGTPAQVQYFKEAFGLENPLEGLLP